MASRTARPTCSAANALDAQAAYESVFSLWGAIMGGVNLLMHGAGWMEGGLHASYEKMILDAELLGMVEAFLEPIVVDDDTLGFEAMQEVGPGGHFFGAAHTQSRFKTAFHKPMLSRLAQLRDVGGGRLARGPGQGQPHLEGDCWPRTSRRRWTRPSARSSMPSSDAARRRGRRPHRLLTRRTP